MNNEYRFVIESEKDSFGNTKENYFGKRLRRRNDLEENFSWGEEGYETHIEFYEDEKNNIHQFECYYSNDVNQGFDYIGIVK